MDGDSFEEAFTSTNSDSLPYMLNLGMWFIFSKLDKFDMVGLSSPLNSTDLPISNSSSSSSSKFLYPIDNSLETNLISFIISLVFHREIY